jgi:hypothetical protein
MTLRAVAALVQSPAGINASAQYVANALTVAGVVAAVGLLWRAERNQEKSRAETNEKISGLAERFSNVETVLRDPDIGLVKAVSLVRQRSHRQANAIQRHDSDIETLRVDVARIDRDVEKIDLHHIVRAKRRDDEARQ